MMLVRVVCLQVVALRLAIGIPFVSLSSTQSPSADLENVALPLSHSDAGDPVPTPQLGTPHVLPFGVWDLGDVAHRRKYVPGADAHHALILILDDVF